MCSLYGFNICGVRPVFSIDACSFFPQCVLVIIHLTGDVQMQQLVPSPGVHRGSGSSGRGVKEAIDHVPHLLHAVLDVLLRVLGEGHAAIPAQALRSGGAGQARP